jgi:hypothetical protein
MTVLGLVLETSTLATLKTFYVDQMALPLKSEDDLQFSVQAGQTRLVFTTADLTAQAGPRNYFFTFGVADSKFDALRATLSRFATLLASNGRNVVQSQNSGTRAFYLRDPAGNTLEFASVPTYAATAIIGISYVGLPVDDSNATQQFLQGQPAIEHPTQWPLVFAKPGGQWFPGSSVAAVNPTMLTLSGQIRTVTKVLDYPYYIQTAPAPK